MALVPGWFILEALVFWIVGRTRGGDLAVLASVLLAWLVIFLFSVWDALFIQGPRDDPREAASRFVSRLIGLRWAAMLVYLIGPGLWIGFVARSPLLVAVAAIAAMVVGSFINRWIGRRRRLRLQSHTLPESVLMFVRGTAVMLAAVLAGTGLRWLLHG